MITLRHQIELESFFLISIVAGFSLFFVIHRNNQFNLPVASVNYLLPTPTPGNDIFSQISPDGIKKIIMKVTQNNDNTRTYNFYTSGGSDVNERFIFSKTLDATSNMAIPFNAWSSDDKYFFIQENAKDKISVFVFKATGEIFSDGQQYFDVTDLFEKRKTGNNFNEATGWASESLIIINTTKQDGAKGPSYWFEVPSKAIIPLATEF